MELCRCCSNEPGTVGRRGECDKDKEAEEKDDGKEEDGMEEESDDEGRFVIQMDVAEEERVS